MSYLSYPGVPGQTYILQYTDDLTPPRTWRPLLPLTTSPITVATSVSSTRYFRCIRVDRSPRTIPSTSSAMCAAASSRDSTLWQTHSIRAVTAPFGSLFPNRPPNSEILLPGPSGSLVPGSVFGGTWDPPNLNLLPGQGIGLVNPGTAFEVTFAGEVVHGAMTSIPPGLSLIGASRCR